MTPRRISIAVVALLIIGAVLVLVSDSTAVDAVGITFIGFSFVLLVSLAFLLVGQSEDRDRTRHPGG